MNSLINKINKKYYFLKEISQLYKMSIIQSNKQDEKIKMQINTSKILKSKEKVPLILKNFNPIEIQMISYYQFKKKQHSL